MLWWHPGAQEVFAIQNDESNAMLAGRLVADVASIVVGAVATGTGTGAAVTGAAACAATAGGGCVLGGAAVIAGGVVLVGQGVGMGVRGVEGLARIASMNINGQGTSSNEINFENEELLEEHFDNHWAEFGYKTKEEYLSGARNLFSGGDGIETFYRNRDRATLFYNKNTNEFGVLNENGSIGTYMAPTDGIYYWWKQIGKVK